MAQPTRSQRRIDALWPSIDRFLANAMGAATRKGGRELYDALKADNPTGSTVRSKYPIHGDLRSGVTIEIMDEGSPAGLDDLIGWDGQEPTVFGIIEAAIDGLCHKTKAALVDLLERSLVIDPTPERAQSPIAAIEKVRKELGIQGPLDVLTETDYDGFNDVTRLLRVGCVLRAPLPGCLLLPHLPGPASLATVAAPAITWDFDESGRVKFIVYEQFSWWFSITRVTASTFTITR